MCARGQHWVRPRKVKQKEWPPTFPRQICSARTYRTERAECFLGGIASRMEKSPVNKGKEKKKAISSKDKSASRVITSQVKWRKFFQQLKAEIRSAAQRTKASPFPPPRATAPRRVTGKECARQGCQAAVPASWHKGPCSLETSSWPLSSEQV